MPARNIVKTYKENSFYHIYNRGINNQNIYINNRDYILFLYYLKRYLTQPSIKPNQVGPRWKANLFDQLQLIAYCLMPNHFHLMIKQNAKNTISDFMRCLSNSYVRYFNEKYERTGSLFQGRYRAVLIESDIYLLHLSRYIHLNPYDITRSDLVKYSYSSYQDYLGKRKTKWLHPQIILDYFRSAQKTDLKDILSYESYVEDYKENSKEILGKLTID